MSDFSRRKLLSSGMLFAGVASLKLAARGVPESKGKPSADEEIPFIAMTEDGPLYPPVEIPWNDDLTRSVNGKAKGKILYLFGKIFTRHGKPLPNTEVTIWQTDINGIYKHPRGWDQKSLDPHFGYFARTKTDQNGFYIFKTIQPRWYLLNALPGSKQKQIPRAAHIHIKIKHIEHGVLTTEAYFNNISHDEVAPKDLVFLSRPKEVREKILLTEREPDYFSSLGFSFDKEAICCRYDLAFLL